MLSTQTAHRRIWQPLWQLPSRAELIFSFAKRELLGRYKGSALGIAWAVLTPVVMIAIFTFIFAGIFGARFGVNHSHWDYALYLFCGLLPWSMFQESVQQSANTIVVNSNLVKRVVFPLEALPAAQVFAALANQLFATVALLIATIIVRQRLELNGHLVPGAAHSTNSVCARRRLAHRITRSFLPRHCAGHHAAANGLALSHAYHLPRIDRARTFSRLH